MSEASDVVDYNTALINQDAAFAKLEPFALYRPRLFIDGNQWCALYGDNLQDGLAGFGDSPQAAVNAFNTAWRESLNA